MKKVIIYTDGACRGNGKEASIGAYGIVLIYNGLQKEIKKSFINTTNNIMELSAVIEALLQLKEPCLVTVHSDSAYVINAVNAKWINKWVKNGWKTSTKEKVKNKELWEKLLELIDFHEIKFVKVKGHSDDELNNRCDELENQAMDEID